MASSSDSGQTPAAPAPANVQPTHAGPAESLPLTLPAGVHLSYQAEPAPQLCVDFDASCASLSWALCAGGAVLTRSVVWCQVYNRDLTLDVDARALLQARLAALGRPEAVGFLTSAAVQHYGVAVAHWADVCAFSVVTAGLGNALCVGDEPGPARTGTINLMCWCNVPLTYNAQLEALSLAAQARTLAVLETGVQSTRSAALATGTGTDCLALLSLPEAETQQPAHSYAGMHTALGHVIGRSVTQATRQALARSHAPRRA